MPFNCSICAPLFLLDSEILAVKVAEMMILLLTHHGLCSSEKSQIKIPRTNDHRCFKKSLPSYD